MFVQHGVLTLHQKFLTDITTCKRMKVRLEKVASKPEIF